MGKREGTEIDDAILVAAVRFGIHGAYELLVGRYLRALFSLAARILGTTQSAEDVVQESFIIAHRALHALREPERFGSWLYTITRNTALRTKSRQDRATFEVIDGDEAVLIEASKRVYRDLQERWERTNSFAALRAEVDRLPAEYREPIELRYWCEMSISEIADFTALPESTVKWRLHAAKQRLRKVLEKREEDR